MKDLVVILGGNSSKNIEWATNLTDDFRKEAPAHLHIYKHWNDGMPDLDFVTELRRLSLFLDKYEGDYCIVAKSAGALLALKGIAEEVLTPTSLVCIGLPITYVQHYNIPIQDHLTLNKVPTLFIQAKNDPLGSSLEVALLVAGRGKFESVPGDNHDYDDRLKIIELSTAFRKKD